MTADLHRVTFTGVDSRTDLGALKAICAEFPRVEFAALWSSSRAGNEPRYPEDPIALLSELPQHQRAIHLCGALAQQLINEHPLTGPLARQPGFGRVQVNAPEYSADDIVNLGWVAKALRVQVIAQARGEVVPFIAGIATLFDRSGGKGIAPDSWPSPEWVYGVYDVVSYAGNLGPETVAEQLPRIAAARGDGPFGIDMESGVRTDDWLDLNKCRAVIKAVEQWEASRG